MTAQLAAATYRRLAEQDERDDTFLAMAFAMEFENQASEAEYTEYLNLLEEGA